MPAALANNSPETITDQRSAFDLLIRNWQYHLKWLPFRSAKPCLREMCWDVGFVASPTATRYPLRASFSTQAATNCCPTPLPVARSETPRRKNLLVRFASNQTRFSLSAPSGATRLTSATVYALPTRSGTGRLGRRPRHHLPRRHFLDDSSDFLERLSLLEDLRR